MKYLPLAALALAACGHLAQADEAALAPDFTKMDWLLTMVDGQPAGYSATLNLGEPGRATGQAPCNSYSADLTRDGADFKLGAIGATKMACPDLAEESDFFQALQGVDTATDGPGRLTLTGRGHALTFVQPID